jgi:hypothetical protein
MNNTSKNATSPTSVDSRPSLSAFVINQVGEVLPPTLFFVIGFNLIALTTQLILADYLIHFANFILVT